MLLVLSSADLVLVEELCPRGLNLFNYCTKTSFLWLTSGLTTQSLVVPSWLKLLMSIFGLTALVMALAWPYW